MAERLRKFHQDDVRTKIQTSQLINRLADHGLGKIELSATQVRSIEVLLKKTLPDLQAVEHSGEIANHYDLSRLTTERLLQIESLLESAEPVDGGTLGLGGSEPHQVH